MVNIKNQWFLTRFSVLEGWHEGGRFDLQSVSTAPWVTAAKSGLRGDWFAHQTFLLQPQSAPRIALAGARFEIVAKPIKK